MTHIFILVKDHLRRHWKSLTLMSLVFACVTSLLMMLEASDTFHLYMMKNSPWTLYFFYPMVYAYYAFLASRFWMNNNFIFIRFSRTLPFRESTLANLVWSMAVVAPPLFSFVIVLLLGYLASCFGKTHSLPIARPLLFLLFATLCSGMLTFVQTRIPRMYGALMARRHMQEGDRVSASYIARILFAVACMVTAIVLLFFPTPTRWLDLTPPHLAGMGLAAFLTWKSYRLRHCLLQSDLPPNAISRRKPKKEIAPLYYGSVLAALAQDLKPMLPASLLIFPSIIGIGYLVKLYLAGSGLVPRDSNIYEYYTSVITLLALMGPTTAVTIQFGRFWAFRPVRALPLTGTQCVLLFLSYPCAETLAVVPSITACLWLTGYNHPLILLLGGFLLNAGLCPFKIFLLARFANRSIFTFLDVFLFLGVSAFIFPMFGVSKLPVLDMHLTPLSPPLLWAGALVLAVLGVGGYYGLRHLVENSSAVYKRKRLPQLFGQGARR